MSVTCGNWNATDPNPAAALFRAEVFNGNWQTNGSVEFALSGSGTGTGQIAWPINANGELEANGVSFDLVVQQGSPHTGTLSVDGQSLTRTKTGTFNYITHVAIVAKVVPDEPKVLRAEWTSVNLTFYNAMNEALVYLLGPSTCPLPGARNSGGVHWDRRLITLSDTTRTRVHVSGTFNLFASCAPNPLTLAATQLQLQVYVWVA